MYQSNYLAKSLRLASIGAEEAVFAYLENGTQVSYGDLFLNAEKMAQVLVAKGIKKGDRVAVQVGKSIQAVELYLGTVLAGGVYLPLNTDYTPSELSYFLNDAAPRVFVCDPALESKLVPVAAQAEVEVLLTLDSQGQGGTLFEEQQLQVGGFEARERAESDLAAILYTSGTTGRSKGAMLSHKALASNALTLSKFWHFEAKDRLIHALPIFHTHGLFVALNVTLSSGSSLYWLTKFNRDRMVQLMAKATVLMGVPTFYVRLLESDELNLSSVENMRLFISGSAPLLSETHHLWSQRTGHAILERYGMTETNMNASNPYIGERRAGSVGLALPGVDIMISDPDTGNRLENGQVGQILVKGENVFSGYWKMPEKTAEELNEDGWFLTGDLGVKDEQGYLSIVGRSKDMIISGGYNVYPKEIEILLDDQQGVVESAVIGLPHKDFGEAVVAVIVAESGSGLQEDGIKAAVKDSLAAYKRPKKVIFLDELPRNTMGKVQKAKLRESYKGLF